MTISIYPVVLLRERIYYEFKKITPSFLTTLAIPALFLRQKLSIPAIMLCGVGTWFSYEVLKKAIPKKNAVTRTSIKVDKSIIDKSIVDKSTIDNKKIKSEIQACITEQPRCALLTIDTFCETEYMQVYLYDKKKNELYFFHARGLEPKYDAVKMITELFNVNKITYNNINNMSCDDNLCTMKVIEEFLKKGEEFDTICKKTVSDLDLMIYEMPNYYVRHVVSSGGIEVYLLI
jgi:hypothetical protein